MAQEGSETSVASSSPTPIWWEITANPLSSWNSLPGWPSQNPSSGGDSSCEEDISASAASFTTASNHSGPSMDSSSADITGEPPDNHLWTQVLLSGGDLQSSQGDGENFLEVLSSKTLATEMFDSNTLDFNGSNLSDLVSNWSIAPPNPQIDHRINPPPPYNFSSTMAQYHTSNITHLKERNMGYMPYVHDIKGENQHDHEIRAYDTYGISNKFSNELMTDVIPWANSRTLSDLISFHGCSLNKHAPVECRGSRLSIKESTNIKKQGYETSSMTRGSGRGSGTTSEGKNKRSEDSSCALVKKTKHESPAVSSGLKLQAPKVKLADRITALQQIVSPFGKTDTASVLLEAINYIRFLQEQVQLLSDPYMKSTANKDNSSWGGLERKDKTELDLRSRGLCLVPVSCTPQVYRENTGPDYWTPTYRGYLYR